MRKTVGTSRLGACVALICLRSTVAFTTPTRRVAAFEKNRGNARPRVASPANAFVPSAARSRRRLLSALQVTGSSDPSCGAATEKWQSHVSTHGDGAEALQDLLERADQQADLALLFVSQYHADRFRDLVEQAATYFGCQGEGPSREAENQSQSCQFLAVVGGGVVGQGDEYDEPSKPSMSLLTGRLPASPSSSLLPLVESFSFNELTNKPPAKDDGFWKGFTTLGDERTPASYFVMGDPWSPINQLLDRVSNNSHAGSPATVVTGGVSVPTGTGPTVALNGNALPQGSLVGVRFGGSLRLQAMVSQGCRPVGPVFTITECHHNAIMKLNDKPALRVLEEAISEDEKRNLNSKVGLVAGLARPQSQSAAGTADSTPQQEDYLVRQIAGYVPAKGAIIVGGGDLREGDLFRFHVRDKDAARQDLQLMVSRVNTERLFQTQTIRRPLAVLQVSCVARGRHMFDGERNVDLSHIEKLVGDDTVGVAGFYANGELGPVGLVGFSDGQEAADEYEQGFENDCFMHGFTTVAAILCEEQRVSVEQDGFPQTSGSASSLDDEHIWE